jgi:cytochrome o ubiquinol oxidase subunit IV
MLDIEHKWNVGIWPLVVGFILSIALTLGAYFFGAGSWVLVLAGVQALVQSIFFMHVGLESKPHWYLISFLFLLLVMVVVVGGSLWIMYNLNYQMMPM